MKVWTGYSSTFSWGVLVCISSFGTIFCHLTRKKKTIRIWYVTSDTVWKAESMTSLEMWAKNRSPHMFNLAWWKHSLQAGWKYFRASIVGCFSQKCFWDSLAINFSSHWAWNITGIGKLYSWHLQNVALLVRHICLFWNATVTSRNQHDKMLCPHRNRILIFFFFFKWTTGMDYDTVFKGSLHTCPQCRVMFRTME